MENYRIYAISLGQRDFDMHHLVPSVPPGTTSRIAYFMWCIKGEKETILVDTGLSDEEANKRGLNGREYLRAKLAGLGIDPDGVKTVIITHLHSDHFSGYGLYPRATFYIQRREVDYLGGPGGRFKQLKEPAADMAGVVEVARAKRIRYLDGDADIAPGIGTVLVGGHTPGIQVVTVVTPSGRAVICSDAVLLYRNLDEGVTGAAADLLQALLAWDRIRPLASSPELIIPGHDPEVLTRFKNPIEAVAEIA